ncbi:MULTISPECIES: type VII secretion target [unclassified Mycolicibacterium]|uniref:type VII secretion target n=1 Tax=unclassified Mycolicibacterium TaxID=2636767 RepID=UPI0012DCA4E3|nr:MULTISPECIES: type VII secretion target [unclassified Mycolicibacterium]MUL81333.1 ESX-1 secretion-associated protein [Mycolicibacterium sp. CBMA 329]MUL87099.1 ESX-1 secretion-associated protein [Mycolicibacterium sp. CBMA 331]MUL98619.1 ESX-1 secretion-associated protein [Mycolicibacterium sp. CBMA 334]MUM29496.1 ESX-1 secretion-associated protein [Mycolicibacterium sp. CBMA 295]MUM37396.1 ESX-1 secretion-associated protein [Mycolicibacterium sp. CBMA 247]
MGELAAARVDAAALSSVAAGYDTVADNLDSVVRDRLRGPVFDGASAGQAHVAAGDAVRTAVDELTDGLRRWSRAGAEVAAVLRSSIDRYAVADARAAARVG